MQSSFGVHFYAMKPSAKDTAGEKSGEKSSAKKQDSKGAEFESPAAIPTNAGSSSGEPTAAKSTQKAEKAKPKTTQNTGVKAKSKTNKVTEDYQGRLERVESLLARFVDLMEQPDDDDVDIDNPDHNDQIMSDDESEIRNFYLPLVQDEPKLNNKTTKSPSQTQSEGQQKLDKSNQDPKPSSDDPDKPMGFAAQYAENAATGEPIDDKIAISIKFLMGHKLQEQAMTQTSEKYPAPSNCEMLDTPRVRPAIWDSVSSSSRSKDLKLQRIQKPLTKGITALAKHMTNSKEPMTSAQQDTFALLCNANFELNCLRKDNFKTEMNQKYTHLCKPSVAVTKWLFGDNLSSQVKDLTEEQKTTAGVMRRQSRGSSRYQPYQQHGKQQRQRYVDAG